MSDGSGSSVGNIFYYPFGATRSGSVPTDKKFTGQRLDQTGLYFYNARYYDATIGRFISADTVAQSITNPQLLNRYSYCMNNSLRYNDPSGRYLMLIGTPDQCANFWNQLYALKDSASPFMKTCLDQWGKSDTRVELNLGKIRGTSLFNFIAQNAPAMQTTIVNNYSVKDRGLGGARQDGGAINITVQAKVINESQVQVYSCVSFDQSNKSSVEIEPAAKIQINGGSEAIPLSFQAPIPPYIASYSHTMVGNQTVNIPSKATEINLAVWLSASMEKNIDDPSGWLVPHPWQWNINLLTGQYSRSELPPGILWFLG